MRLWVGIDCGIHGGMALYDSKDDTLLEVEPVPQMLLHGKPMSCATDIGEILSAWRSVRGPMAVAIERQQFMFGKKDGRQGGGVSTLSLGMHYMAAIAGAGFAQLPTYAPVPLFWKNRALPADLRKGKKGAIIEARRRWELIRNLYATDQQTLSGLCDAALLASVGPELRKEHQLF